MTWAVVTKRFIAQEGNCKPGARIQIRDPERLDFLVRGGYVRTDAPAAQPALGTWAGDTVAIFAGGPSLTPEDVAACVAAGVRRIAVNDAYVLDPAADMHYACDLKWHQHHHAALAAHFPGPKVTRDPVAAREYGLQYIASESYPGLGRTPGLIHEGGNSGYQAVNLAYQMGARRIILLGFDMGKDGKQTHWFGAHPPGLEVASPYKAWVEKFGALALDLEAEGVEVVNCSRRTALKCFPRADLADALAHG